MIKRTMILGLVVAMTAMMAACGDDDDKGGGGGGGGGATFGEANFEVTGDMEESVVDGAAYFETLDLSDVSGTPDYQFQITIAQSVPVGGDDDPYFQFSYATDNGDFRPEPGDYEVGFVPFAETWQGLLEREIGEDGLVAHEDGDTRLTIESASASEIVGTFELDLVEAVTEEGTEATATGSFRAVAGSDF